MAARTFNQPHVAPLPNASVRKLQSRHPDFRSPAVAAKATAKPKAPVLTLKQPAKTSSQMATTAASNANDEWETF
jgi:hypothetical protein